FRAWREADEERGRYVERATRAWEQAGTGDEADVERAIARFDQARRVEDIGSRASPRRVTGLMGWERKKPLVKESLTSG
ncbi:MAG: hypothetical protein LBK12_06945, partial [Odoribacteraceae bacterium]|nr:hypothetical protein [Odoribacteraceae bacterium]